MRVTASILAAGLSILLAGCGSSDSTAPPPSGTETGTVTGSVINAESGAGAGSGTVTASRTGFAGSTASPNASGAFSITGLAVGAWTLQYTPGAGHQLAQGESGSRSAAVTANQTTTVSAFQIRPQPPQSGLVEIRLTAGSTFEPASVTITPGTTVRWINDAAMEHTITPENAGQPGVWERQVTNSAGVVYEHTFNEPSQTYRYRCEPHSAGFDSGMVGMITVTAG
jgi:plastocyanin